MPTYKPDDQVEDNEYLDDIQFQDEDEDFLQDEKQRKPKGKKLRKFKHPTN